MKLQQIQVITRHGARCPIYWTKQRFEDFPNLPEQTWEPTTHDFDATDVGLKYEVRLGDGTRPTCPTYDSSEVVTLKGGCKSGQLTNLGKKQHQDLGKKLAGRYIDGSRLVSPAYNKNEVYVRSSYYDRTVLSAACFLSGFFQDSQSEEPVVIKTKDPRDEDIVANQHGCVEFAEWLKYVFSEDARTREEAEVEDYINGLMGKQNGASNASLYQINDLIRCLTGHGFDVPHYLLKNNDLISKYEMSLMSTLLGKDNVDIQRICIGKFLQTLSSRIVENVEDSRSTEPRMLLYSAHDWTLLSLLYSFGVNVAEWPTFASNIVVELYDSLVVRVLYNDQPLLLDGTPDTEFLPVDRFLRILRGVYEYASPQVQKQLVEA